QHVAGQRRLSAHTCAGYRRDLQAAAVVFQAAGCGCWQDVATRDVRQLVATRHRQGIAATSIARQLSALRSLYAWLMRDGRAQHNPARDVRAPKQARKLPQTVDVDALASILDVRPQRPIDVRDHALLELFYSAGVRLAEAIGRDVA